MTAGPARALRPVRIAATGCVARAGAAGAVYLQARSRLGAYPARITERLEHWAQHAPDRTFLAQRDAAGRWRHLSYADALARVRRIGRALLDRQLSQDRPILILSGNGIEHGLLALAAMYTGVLYAPVAPAYSLHTRDFAALRRIVAQIGPALVFAADGAAYEQALSAVLPDEVELACCSAPAARPATPFAELESAPAGPAVDDAHRRVGPDTIAKVLFTSGSTGRPKGVVNTQRMLCANQEMLRSVLLFLADEPPVICDWSPWNHTAGGNHNFGLTLYNGGTLYIDEGRPAPGLFDTTVRNLGEVACTAHFAVPRLYELLLPHLRSDAALRATFFSRLRLLFYAAAGLGQRFWDQLREVARDACGEEILIMTGFGCTETAPFALSTGSAGAFAGMIGFPAPGLELKLAPVDGKLEARARGPNVTPGYWRDPDDAARAFEDGWLHTGDIGGMDEQGRVYIRGRRKEMIVTPEGLNVFPEDIERALLRADGVRDAAVVGRTVGGQERVHAVLLLEPGAEPDAIVRAVNPTLADHQKIRSTSVWPGDALPRTEGTRKLRRAEVKRWVDEGGPPPAGAAAGGPAAAGIVAALARREDVTPETTIEELGLSSLERVELLMALEEHAGRTLDEGEVAAARTVADLEALLKEEAQAGAAVEPAPDRAAPAGGAGVASEETRRAGAAAAAEGPVKFPRWNRTWPAWMARRVSLPTWILPLASAFARVEVTGLEHLRGVEGPVVFAANHQSHMDTPAVLIALPPRWRYRVTVAMAKEFFKAHFFPEQYGRRAWLTNSLNYYLASLFFNAFPLPQREAGTRQTLRYIGALLGEGYSVLIFPEGKRTQAGEINPFRPGIGMIAARLDVPVIPVGLSGLHQILHQSWKMARPGRARVAFGPPLRLEGDDYVALAKQVEEAVRLLVH